MEDTQNTIERDKHYVEKSHSTALQCQEAVQRTAGRTQSLGTLAKSSKRVIKKGRNHKKSYEKHNLHNLRNVEDF